MGREERLQACMDPEDNLLATKACLCAGRVAQCFLPGAEHVLYESGRACAKLLLGMPTCLEHPRVSGNPQLFMWFLKVDPAIDPYSPAPEPHRFEGPAAFARGWTANFCRLSCFTYFPHSLVYCRSMGFSVRGWGWQVKASE